MSHDGVNNEPVLEIRDYRADTTGIEMSIRMIMTAFAPYKDILGGDIAKKTHVTDFQYGSDTSIEVHMIPIPLLDLEDMETKSLAYLGKTLTKMSTYFRDNGPMGSKALLRLNVCGSFDSHSQGYNVEYCLLSSCLVAIKRLQEGAKSRIDLSKLVIAVRSQKTDSVIAAVTTMNHRYLITAERSVINVDLAVWMSVYLH